MTQREHRKLEEHINRKAGCGFWKVSILTGDPKDDFIMRSLRDPAFFMMYRRQPWRILQQWWWRVRWQFQTGKRWWETSGEA